MSKRSGKSATKAPVVSAQIIDIATGKETANEVVSEVASEVVSEVASEVVSEVASEVVSEITSEVVSETMSTEIAIIAPQDQNNALKVAAAIGYEGSLQSEILIEGIRQFQDMANYSMLEVGKRLLLLKEVTPRGDFLIALDNLGISIRSAQRIMSASVRLTGLGSNAASFLHLPTSKLLELLVEDDDTLNELAEGGTVAGLKLDDIDKTPTRTLRLKLREKQEDNNVLQSRNEKLATDNNRLLNQIEKLKNRELTRDDLEKQRINDCQNLRKGFAEALDILGQQTNSLDLIISDFWANQVSLDNNTVDSVRDLLNLFNGSWIHIHNRFESSLTNWYEQNRPRP